MSGKITFFAQLIALMAFTNSAFADRIAIIGTGDVAGALGPEFAALGHDIVYGSRDPSRDEVKALVERTGGKASATTQRESVVDADIVVLAVPGRLAEMIAKDLGDLSGKIVIDPTNNYSREGVPHLAGDTSNGELIQAAAPDAHVVKALNTVGAQNMMPGRAFSGQISVPVAGDDSNAKERVAQLIDSLGLDATDVGPLFNARFVEAMAPLYVYMNVFARPPGGFEYSFSHNQ